VSFHKTLLGEWDANRIRLCYFVKILRLVFPANNVQFGFWMKYMFV
jgi:hypothetical protein